MSETEQDHHETTVDEEPTPVERRRVELETGPLLPRWLKYTIWGIMGSFCLFAFVWIGRSMVAQHKVLAYLDVLSGPWDGDPPSMQSDVVTDGQDIFEIEARSSLLFILQRLVVQEVQDPRMARAITLRKAVEWGANSKRREMLSEILAHMDSEGNIPPNYELPPAQMEVLKDMIAERKEIGSESYEERMMTEVLEWIAEGRPTQAKGPERRRIVALENKYAKRVFMGAERDILKKLAETWSESNDETKELAASKFRMMLDDEACQLSPEASELCKEQADKLEDNYLLGQERLSEVALHLVKYIENNNVFIDHPDVWEVIRLCHHRYKPVRDNMKDAAYALRNRQYCLKFMSDFLRKDEINPVMAVETVRLTKEEHETLLREENHRRRIACLDVAGRIARNYCREQYDIDGVPRDRQGEYFETKIIRTIELLTEDDDEDIAEKAASVFESVRKVCSDYIE